MVSSFSQLKKNRKRVKEQVNEQLESENKGNSHVDDRFWKPKKDAEGNFKGTIRFIGPAKGEDIHWVRFWKHIFKGPGGEFYWENCLSSVGKDDPVNEYNSLLWNQGNEDQARAQKRKLTYVANILVIDDPAEPENNGKVFLFEFGKQIFDKINEAMFPEIEEDEPFIPFDFWEGAPFKLVIKQKDKYPNYESSKFLSPEPISESEDEMAKIFEEQYQLSEFVDPDSHHYKTYDELKARLERVLGISLDDGSSSQSNSESDLTSQTEDLDDDEDLDVDVDSEDESEFDVSEDEDDDDLEDFQNLVD